MPKNDQTENLRSRPESYWKEKLTPQQYKMAQSQHSVTKGKVEKLAFYKALFNPTTFARSR
jgi:hypothetical protein